LDDAHLIRMAGRFSRRLHAFAKAHGIPVIDCERGARGSTRSPKSTSPPIRRCKACS
jgi:hypothetical protein